MSSRNLKKTEIIGLSLLAAGGFWYYFFARLELYENAAQNAIQTAYEQAEANAVAQYSIAKRNGDAADICAHAPLVAATYLQAQDERNYRTWKQTRQADCAGQGVPAQ